MTDIALSIVSHGQIELVVALLQDLGKHCNENSLSVILTLNIPEELPASLDQLPYPLQVVRNTTPLGFGENHNRAFQQAEGSFFCVINPDVRIASDIFPKLTGALKNPSVGVVAPLVVDGEGAIEDSARKFPTPFKIFCKLFGRCRGPDYELSEHHLEPDWVGGMFMLFRREVYGTLRGFDQKFFLYYEDVDLCARIRLAGFNVVMIPTVRAIHLARRSSHRNAAYSLMHIRSMLRFFMSRVFVKVMLQRGR